MQRTGPSRGAGSNHHPGGGHHRGRQQHQQQPGGGGGGGHSSPAVGLFGGGVASTANKQPTCEVESAETDKVVPDNIKNFLEDLKFPSQTSSDDESEQQQQQQPPKPQSKSRQMHRSSREGSKRGGGGTKKTRGHAGSGGTASATQDENHHHQSHPPPDLQRSTRKGKLNEYEIALLWNQLKDNIPSGKVNKLQMCQLFKQVFPKCHHYYVEKVAYNLLDLFDTKNTGYANVRDIMTMMALSMDEDTLMREKLRWSYRFMDEEGLEKIDRDDLIDIFKRICVFCKRQVVFVAAGMHEKERKEEDYLPPESVPVRMLPKEEESAESESSKPSTPVTKKKLGSKKPNKPDDIRAGMPLMSSKLTHRVEAQQKMKKKKKHEVELKKAQQAAEEKEKEKAAAEAVKPREETLDDIELNEEEIELLEALGKALDKSRSLYVSLEEYVEGCLRSDSYIEMIHQIDGDMVWGDLLIGQ